MVRSGSVVALILVGVVFGQQLGETAAIVDIPNAGDITILNQAGVRTNNSGYALVPYVTPYRKKYCRDRYIKIAREC